jgi:inorganic pyrophosphatase
VLAVPATDPNFDEYHDLSQIPAHFPKEVRHFFNVYKQLQGTESRDEGWVDAVGARETIVRSIQIYHEKFPPTGV